MEKIYETEVYDEKPEIEEIEVESEKEDSPKLKYAIGGLTAIGLGAAGYAAYKKVKEKFKKKRAEAMESTNPLTMEEIAERAERLDAEEEK